MSQRAAQMNPGNINVRLGNLMALDEAAVKAGDLETSSNLRDLMSDYLSVYLTPEQLASYDAMPGFAYGDQRRAGDVWRDLSRRHRYLLACARPHGVFAKAPELEEGIDDVLDQEGPITA